MILASLGLVLAANVTLHVEQLTDVPVDEVAVPLLADLAGAIEARTQAAVFVDDPGSATCSREEKVCLERLAAQVDEVVFVRLLGGIRRVLVVAERVRISGGPLRTISSVRVDLELERASWRLPFWGAVRTLFPESRELNPLVTSPLASVPVRERGLRGEHWLVVGVGAAAAVAGTTLLIHGAGLRSAIEQGDPTQTKERFDADVSQLGLENGLGSGLVAGGLGAILTAVIWAVVPLD